MNNPDELVSPKDICHMLKISKVTLWKLRKDDNTFPKAFNIGRKLLWKRSEIEAYIESTRK